MKMVERVAKAVGCVDYDRCMAHPAERGTCGDCLQSARAAIKAMREPTDKMVEIGMQEFADPCWSENVRNGFGKMIDAALTE